MFICYITVDCNGKEAYFHNIFMRELNYPLEYVIIYLVTIVGVVAFVSMY